MTQLWVGNVEYWENEEILMNTIRQITRISPKSCWFVKDRVTNQRQNYGFLEFGSVNEATDVLKLLKGSIIPNSNGLTFNLNWGSARIENDPETLSKADGYSIYIGNLPTNVDEIKLLDYIKKYCPGAINARLIYQQGISKGFGFVKFGSHQEVIECIRKLNGTSDFGRPLKVNEASQNRAHLTENISDNINTTLFLSDIDPSVVKEETLLHHFKQFGNVLKVQIESNRPNWATVKMETHVSAESAKNALQGSRFGGTTKCNIQWGRSIDDSLIEKVTQVTVPIMKPPKISRKLHNDYFNENGIKKVLNIIQKNAEINRIKPFDNLNIELSNKNFNQKLINNYLFDFCDLGSNFQNNNKFWYY